MSIESSDRFFNGVITSERINIFEVFAAGFPPYPPDKCYDATLELIDQAVKEKLCRSGNPYQIEGPLYYYLFTEGKFIREIKQHTIAILDELIVIDRAQEPHNRVFVGLDDYFMRSGTRTEDW